MSSIFNYRNWYLGLSGWGMKAHGPEDAPQFNAILGLSTIATVNCFSLLMLVELIFGTAKLPYDGSIVAPVVWVAMLAIHYFVLRPRLDVRISERPKVEKRRDLASAVVYMVGSLVLFFALVAYRAHLDGQ